ncbi:hypothetical protein [Pelagibius sp. Alg239-R121]|uniref:hypothetical protein n=1 Tax=Pelagibius sp. Alg239-R121 TaxID=2993448 RepID=UPI0024A71172|nr:hypothetical protein [Pelagibius sp. Alg239-R121]
MRAASTVAALGMGLIVLSACVQKPASNGQLDSAVSASTDAPAKTGTDWIYEELMSRILKAQVGRAGSGSSYRKGERNPYQEGLRGSPHKALSACLIWDYTDLRVEYHSWHARGHPDWSIAAFNAVKHCNDNKRQRQFSCTCQVIDHDDENVLKVPADFLTKYEKKFSVSTQH